MAALNVFSLNCHGVNDGIIKYLNDVNDMFDIILLQETWLSNKTCVQLEKISSELSVVHCSAMEIKLYSLIICEADLLVAQQYCLRTVWHAPTLHYQFSVLCS